MNKRIIIMGHGPFPSALKESAKMLLGKVAENIVAIELYPQDTAEKIKQKLEDTLQATEEALIFADILGGTPSRVIAEVVLASNKKYEVVSGVNLPMVLQALIDLNEKDVKTLAREIAVQGKGSIVVLSERFSE
ncbi:PTS sugar transporter subunit IIA [Thermococcus aggregans]|uniref:PTS sugar transporter subunit IIA n=1 Tax=Thermococcus aggregans TaxID=110163 RepID=A0A9E7MWM8_THEAG|nr:PTS sugar transporter subunit IIA [Thermococcus aggregans]USS40144.1 PTS sugar transporter subunit IIA [Thermococcus aggregans]